MSAVFAVETFPDFAAAKLVSVPAHPSDFTETARDRRPMVVIAEDDDDIRDALHIAIGFSGYRVFSFSDGDLLIDFLGRCEATQDIPDLIITDHRMPGYSGIDVLEGLQVAGWRTPVILITAFGREVRDCAQALGACAVFQKPFNLDDLRATAMCWIESSAQDPSLARPRSSRTTGKNH